MKQPYRVLVRVSPEEALPEPGVQVVAGVAGPSYGRLATLEHQRGRGWTEHGDPLPPEAQVLWWAYDPERPASSAPPDGLDDPIHRAFGLSYAAYLVIPRVALQSMPEDWQAALVALMEQLWRDLEADSLTDNTYDVRLRGAGGAFVRDPLADYGRGRRRLPRRDGHGGAS